MLSGVLGVCSIGCIAFRDLDIWIFSVSYEMVYCSFVGSIAYKREMWFNFRVSCIVR